MCMLLECFPENQFGGKHSTQCSELPHWEAIKKNTVATNVKENSFNKKNFFAKIANRL